MYIYLLILFYIHAFKIIYVCEYVNAKGSIYNVGKEPYNMYISSVNLPLIECSYCYRFQSSTLVEDALVYVLRNSLVFEVHYD